MIYHNGVYYNLMSSAEQLARLEKEAPQKYYRLFRSSVVPGVTTAINSRNQIYQIFYNDKSRQALDGGFIPIENGNTHNYENDVILQLWRSRHWTAARRIGVLSWRLYEKTGITSDMLSPSTLKSKVTILHPKGYEKYDHPYSRYGYGGVDRLVREADEHRLFPFKLKEYNVDVPVWCNYWIASPEIFDDYCTRYLSKCVEFFKGRPSYNLKEKHRGQEVPAMTFFLEGLFSVYLHREKIKSIKII